MNKDYIDNFYSLLIKFLTKNNLENYPSGLTEDEIQNYEIQNSIKFPKAFRVFLLLMGNSELLIFDYKNFTIEALEEAQEVSSELLEQDNYSIGENMFAFKQWQGYNFHYIDLKSENPNVTLYIEAGCESEDAPPEIYKYGSFTQWLCQTVETSLELRKELKGLEIKDLIIELKEIEKAGNKSYK